MKMLKTIFLAAICVANVDGLAISRTEKTFNKRFFKMFPNLECDKYRTFRPLERMTWNLIKLNRADLTKASKWFTLFSNDSVNYTPGQKLAFVKKYNAKVANLVQSKAKTAGKAVESKAEALNAEIRKREQDLIDVINGVAPSKPQTVENPQATRVRPTLRGSARKVLRKTEAVAAFKAKLDETENKFEDLQAQWGQDKWRNLKQNIEKRNLQNGSVSVAHQGWGDGVNRVIATRHDIENRDNDTELSQITGEASDIDPIRISEEELSRTERDSVKRSPAVSPVSSPVQPEEYLSGHPQLTLATKRNGSPKLPHATVVRRVQTRNENLPRAQILRNLYQKTKTGNQISKSQKATTTSVANKLRRTESQQKVHEEMMALDTVEESATLDAMDKIINSALSNQKQPSPRATGRTRGNFNTWGNKISRTIAAKNSDERNPNVYWGRQNRQIYRDAQNSSNVSTRLHSMQTGSVRADRGDGSYSSRRSGNPENHFLRSTARPRQARLRGNLRRT